MVREAQQHNNMNNYFTPASPVHIYYVRYKPTNDIHLLVFMQSQNSTPINYTGITLYYNTELITTISVVLKQKLHAHVFCVLMRCLSILIITYII